MNLYKFIFTRYVFYGFIGLEIILMPLLLSGENYGNLEFIKYTSSLLPLGLLGAHTGYMKIYYNSGRDYFNELLFNGLLVLVAIGFLGSIIYSNWLYCLSTVAVGLSFILEKKLLINKKFTLAILFKPLLSLFMITIAGLSYLVYSVVELNSVIFGGYLLSIVAFFFLFKNSLEINDLKLKFSFDFWKYYKMLKEGLMLNLSTVVFTVFMYSDRFLINTYFNQHLSSYSFAFNFSALVIVGLSSLNMISQVDLGENTETSSRENIIQIFKKAFFTFTILGVLGFMGIWIYQYFITSLPFVKIQYLIILLTIGTFFLFGSVSPFIFYKGRQSALTYSLIICTIANIFLSYLLCKYGCSWIWVISSSLLFILIYIAIGMKLLFKLINE